MEYHNTFILETPDKPKFISIYFARENLILINNNKVKWIKLITLVLEYGGSMPRKLLTYINNYKQTKIWVYQPNIQSLDD